MIIEDIEQQKLDKNMVLIINSRLQSFGYDVVNVDDSQLSKKDLETKYKYLKLIYTFLTEEVGLKF